MFSLIRKHYSLSRGESIDITLERLTGIQKDTVESVKTFYKTYPTRGPSNDPFVRLLYTMALGINAKPSDYFKLAQQEKYEWVNLSDFTDEQNRGDIHDVFWGDKVKTLILASSDKSLPEILGRDWKKLTPITVLRYPGLKESLVRPDLSTQNEGVGVVAVDLPVFAYMFGNWVTENVKKPVEERERPETFLQRWVYPNMMDSMQQQVMFNIINNPENMSDLEVNRTPVLVQDRMFDIGEKLMDYVNRMRANSSFEQVLSSIPAIYGDDLLDAFNPPSLERTPRMYWVEFAAASPIIRALTFIAYETPDYDSLNSRYERIRRIYEANSIIKKVPDDKTKTLLGEEFSTINAFFI